MLFKVAVMLAAVAGAAALSLLETRNTSFGTLSVYGTRALAARQDLRCRDPGIICDSAKHVPDRTTCKLLARAIDEEQDATLAGDATSLCLGTTVPGQTCCTTWGEAVTDLTVGSLLVGVQGMLESCTDPYGSGKFVPADLDGVCTPQCLASVPDKCEF